MDRRHVKVSDNIFAFLPVLRKRKDSGSTVDPSAPPAKLHCPEGAPMASSKSKLNEMAQKNKLPLPTYNTVTVTNGFFSTVEFNGRQFKSAAICTKKKDAEQSAAKVALDTLMGNPSDIDTIPQLKEAGMIFVVVVAVVFLLCCFIFAAVFGFGFVFFFLPVENGWN